MINKKSRTIAVLVSLVLVGGGLLSASAASANSSRTMSRSGSPVAAVSYNSSTNTFSITDKKADGYGVQVEYSFTKSPGVKYVYNSGGSGTTVARKVTVPSGASQINWRIVLVNGTTAVYTDSVITKDSA